MKINRNDDEIADLNDKTIQLFQNEITCAYDYKCEHFPWKPRYMKISSVDKNDQNFGKNRYTKTNLGSKESLKKVLLL